MFYIVLKGLVAVGTLGFIIGIPFCIFFAVKAREEPDNTRKKRLKRRAIWSILGPILLVLLSQLVWGLATVLTEIF